MKLSRKAHEILNTLPIQLGPLHHMNRLVLDAENWESYDPFLFVTEDIFSKGNFHFHPHRGLETLTMVLEGSMQVENSFGESWIFKSGDAQWTTAGVGVVHNEQPPGDEEALHTIQFWINLPSAVKRVPLRYQNLWGDRIPVVRHLDASIRLYSGTLEGISAPTLNYAPVLVADVAIPSGGTSVLDLPGSLNAFFYLTQGSGRFGAESTKLVSGQVVHFPPVDAVSSLMHIQADTQLRGILFAGLPLHEASTRPAYSGNAAQKALAYADPDEPVGSGEDIVAAQMNAISAHPCPPEVLDFPVLRPSPAG
ncbi:pirin family protein [Streptomyces collinus]|uniref:pirin family protein n=1 Tax=Streptomyces collinus TaxID=42684 RepID=UPI0036D02A14